MIYKYKVYSTDKEANLSYWRKECPMNAFEHKEEAIEYAIMHSKDDVENHRYSSHYVIRRKKDYIIAVIENGEVQK